MSFFRRIATIATVAVGLAAAATPAKAHYENTYFPLHVGNEWKYVVTSPLALEQPLQVTVDASWVQPTNGNIYFRIRNYNGDFHWLRQTSTSRIYEYQDRQWYRLGAGPGFPWQMTVDTSGTHGGLPCSDGAQLEVVSRGERVTVPAGTFTSVIHIRFRTQCRDAGVTDEWFARGVGLIKRSESNIAGARTSELQYAKITDRTYGQATPAARVTVSVDGLQADYYENHMPGPGPRPTEGPEIKFQTTIKPTGSQAVTLNFVDFNTWDVQIFDPSGNVVWSNPKLRAQAPAGGVNRTIPVAGLKTEQTLRLPFGSAQGRYRVVAKLLQSNIPAVEKSFTYGWAF
jgi:hypothetical protein